MYQFWDGVIGPFVALVKPKSIVEIGSGYGLNAKNLAEFARKNDATVRVIDLFPKYDHSAFKKEYGRHIEFHIDRSLNAISSIEDFDLVLIDGDHNWYTVFHELQLIGEHCVRRAHPFPAILLHHVGWPYGRRDLYSDPETIPPGFRKPYKQLGLRPESKGLVPQGGFNSHLYHSVSENDMQNGVLTAVEDFLKETAEHLEFMQLPGLHGLGILVPTALLNRAAGLREFLKGLDASPPLTAYMEHIERVRVTTAIELAQRDIENERLRTEATARGPRLETLQTEVATRDQANAALQVQVDTLLRSRSWRVTRPLRRIAAFGRRVLGSGYDALRNTMRFIGSAGWAVTRSPRSALELSRTMLIVKRSGLFDEEFYLRQNPDVAAAGMSPMRHYLLHGAAEGRMAYLSSHSRNYFDAGYYLERYPEVAAQGINPLLHYIENGAAEGRETMRPALRGTAPAGQTAPDAARPGNFVHFLGAQSVLSTAAHAPPATVIVPIYNAVDEVARCIESLARHTNAPTLLLLIDDASPDPRIATLLQRYVTWTNVRVLTNARNLGFVETVNRGMSEAKGDVVILNSDTEVTPRWLESLMLAAYANPRTASVTAVSNSAGAFSVPDVEGPNAIPVWLTVDDMARAVSRQNHGLLVRTPTGNGFCMYVKREAIDAVGLFDPEAFPRGYGEENDWCMRALRAGWEHVIDGATYVYHTGSASFRGERLELSKKALATMHRLYPDYHGHVIAFIQSEQLKAVQHGARLAQAQQESLGAAPRKRVLQVMVDVGGGAPQATMDIVRALEGQYEFYLLQPRPENLRLARIDGGTLQTVASWDLAPPWRATEFTREDYREIFYQLLVEFKFELVHIQHLLGQTFDLVDVAKGLRIPVVMSLHDFYLVCPSVQLLDDKMRFCGGACTEGKEQQCRLPIPWLKGLPVLKQGWIDVWRSQVERMMQHVDILVAPSPSAREVVRRSYPALHETRFEVIENGLDMPQATGIAAPPLPRGKLRILVAGYIDIHKGSELILALKRLDRDERLEFHLLGLMSDSRLEKAVIYHGPYQRDQFIDRVRAITPHFAAVFSICSETYSYTLSESWAAGVPALVTDIGAPMDRVRAHGGGWVISRDPERAYEQILAIADDRKSYEKELKRANLRGVAPTARVGQEYDALYKDVARGQRAFLPLSVSTRRARGVIRVAAFMPGEIDGWQSSGYIRVAQPLGHPSIAERIHLTTPPLADFLYGTGSDGYDIALVQHTGVPAESVAAFIERCEQRKIPILFDINDTLFDRPPGEKVTAVYGGAAEALKELARRAAAVTISTAELEAVLRQYNANVHVVPNRLDERLWFGPLPLPAQREQIRAGLSPKQVNILYFATDTRHKDLELVMPVIEDLYDTAKVPVKFFLIGGREELKRRPWTERIVVPMEAQLYPNFVRWLRGPQGNFHIGVVPLVDSALNRSTSQLKYLEFTALGVPVAASAIGPYKALQDGVNALVCENSRESWTRNLRRLCEDAELRRELHRNALEEVTAHHLLKQHGSQYLGLLESIVG